MKPVVKEAIDTVLIFAAGLLLGYGLATQNDERDMFCPAKVPEFFSRPGNLTGSVL